MKRPPLTDYGAFPFDWVTPPELAAAVECDPRSILRMINEQTLDAYRVGRNWRILLDDAQRAFPRLPQHRKSA